MCYSEILFWIISIVCSQQVISPRELLLIAVCFFIFYFFLALAVNPRDVCVGKSHTDQHFRVTYITFLFHSDARFKFQQVVYMPKCYCYVIGLLDIHVNKHLNGCPQQIGW